MCAYQGIRTLADITILLSSRKQYKKKNVTPVNSKNCKMNRYTCHKWTYFLIGSFSYSCISYFSKWWLRILEILLALFYTMISFDSPENIRKPLVFWCFQGDHKVIMGKKGLKLKYWSAVFSGTRYSRMDQVKFVKDSL